MKPTDVDTSSIITSDALNSAAENVNDGDEELSLAESRGGGGGRGGFGGRGGYGGRGWGGGKPD